MATFVKLTGLTEFEKYVKDIDPKGPPVLFYFSGAKLPSGESWCPDCGEAEPIVHAFLSEVKKELIFASVDVGDREAWRDKANPFRTDARVKLMVIPTILIWKGVQRLEGSQCCKRELLQMLTEDEE